MKKYFFTLLVVASLVACNEKPHKVVDGTIDETTTEMTATPDNDDAQAQAIDKMQEAALKSNYTPTGNVDTDAQALVDKQLELALKEANGEKDEALTQEVTAMLVKLSQYYADDKRQDEFTKALTQKLEKGINNIKNN